MVTHARLSVLRGSGHRPREQAALPIANFAALEAELAGGAMTVITNDGVRLRPLPHFSKSPRSATAVQKGPRRAAEVQLLAL